MSSDRVLVDVRDQIAYVTLNRPDKLNGLDFPMFHALVAAAKRIEDDRDVRVVILQGAGKAFCAGLDFAEFGKVSGVDRAKAFAKLPGRETNLFQEACWAWRALPVPVIAVPHGYCYGGGLQLALAADFRISARECEYSIMEAKWGLIPDMTGSVTLRELMPMDQVKRLAMTAERFDAEAALGYHLVTAVSDEPLKEAEALAGQLIERSPDAVAYTKRLFHETWTRSPRWAFWTETVLQGRLMLGENHKIARKAGLAKQRPQWVSRKLG
ncbi:MAG: crotonase/enoyl-CoA hydratase family protein [Jatrophihabitans sp.]|uniref:crotonase/enoyl-CoA hydratase family protein n=1 Tax=Jatrophihabitans sp. TaxID=1932789 RepID=UPI003F810F18